MQLKTLDLDAVQAFALVASLGSFTRTAEATGSTQSGISLKLKRLETFLGRKLVERTPRSVRLTADYGDIGLSISDSHQSFNVTGALNVPIFNGGRTRGRLVEAEAELRDRRNEAEDLKAGIYYEVRTAFLDLQAGHEQLEVASRGRDLAAQELVQARDRFSAGVAGNIEVVQAQEAVALATDQYISALFTSNLATGNLVRALGIAQDAVRQYLGEGR